MSNNNRSPKIELDLRRLKGIEIYRFLTTETATVIRIGAGIITTKFGYPKGLRLVFVM